MQRDGAELILRTAEALAGASRRRFALSTRVLRSRPGNSCYLHQLVMPGEAAGGDVPIRFVEKRSARSGEYRFHTAVATTLDAEKRSLHPNLYGAAKDGDYVVLTEFLPRVGTVPKPSKGMAIVVADSIFPIWRDASRSGPETHRRKPGLTTDLLSAFLAAAETGRHFEDQALRSRLQTMAEGWGGLAEANSALPVGLCHDDIHWRNMARDPEAPEGDRFRFIDWEHFGTNHAGADLHHFVRLGIGKPAEQGFAEAVLDRYAALMQADHAHLDRPAVALGAYAYALFRSMMRAIQRGSAEEFAAAVELYAMARRLAA